MRFRRSRPSSSARRAGSRPLCLPAASEVANTEARPPPLPALSPTRPRNPRWPRGPPASPSPSPGRLSKDQSTTAAPLPLGWGQGPAGSRHAARRASLAAEAPQPRSAEAARDAGAGVRGKCDFVSAFPHGRCDDPHGRCDELRPTGASRFQGPLPDTQVRLGTMTDEARMCPQAQRGVRRPRVTPAPAQPPVSPRSPGRQPRRAGTGLRAGGRKQMEKNSLPRRGATARSSGSGTGLGSGVLTASRRHGSSRSWQGIRHGINK